MAMLDPHVGPVDSSRGQVPEFSLQNRSKSSPGELIQFKTLDVASNSLADFLSNISRSFGRLLRSLRGGGAMKLMLRLSSSSRALSFNDAFATLIAITLVF